MLGEELLVDETFFPIERDSLMRATISVFELLWKLAMSENVGSRI